MEVYRVVYLIYAVGFLVIKDVETYSMKISVLGVDSMYG